MSNDLVKKVLWWLCLLVAPTVLITVELFHPAGFTHNPGMYEYLHKPQPYNPQFSALGYFGPQWWFILHMIQTPMMGLVAVGLWLLADKVASPTGLAATTFAWLSRVATFVFFVYYTALDSIGGIGLSKTIEITEQLAHDGKLTPEQVMGVEQVLNQTWTNSWVGGVGSFISLTGSWAVFTSALLVAIALFLAKKAPWPALILLVAFGWELQVSHTMPHGPIAFSLLIISALWIWWSGRRPVS
ncbi:MAG: hypothetical protein QOH49_2476 [Acidobacteriota bacterium]|jgi:hypothetical protein|nr:hypothetical protein [Acidobacteriota bacterium]